MSQEPANLIQEEQKAIKTVLLVEDDNGIGELFVEAISQETSYLAVYAADGQEALKVVANIKPNLFILDYHLPGMDGIQLYDTLHAIKDFASTPAIMMSARLPRHELEKRGILGMNKPIDLDEFLQVIERLIG